MNAPEADAKRIRELLHPPGGFKSGGHKVHGDKQPHAEAFDELAGAARVAIADAPVHGKHGHVKMASDFADVLQFAQIPLLFLGGVNVHTKFLAVYQAAMVVLGQEAGIPVVQVAGVEEVPALHFHYPGNAAVRASGGHYADAFILPDASFGQPGIGILLARPAMLQDVFGQDIGDVRLPLPPCEDAG